MKTDEEIAEQDVFKYRHEQFEEDSQRSAFWAFAGGVIAWAVAMGIWYFFIWAAIGGWRVFHAWMDRLMGVIQ